MNTNAPTMGTGEDVVSAFEMLLEEIEAEIDLINAVGTKGMDSRDYTRARAAIGRAENLNTFRNKVAGLREGWEELFEQPRKQEDPAIKAERQAIARTVTGRLPRGLRTPEPFFRIPILRALAAMPNGGGKMNEVLDRVEALVKPTLKAVDHDRLASTDTIRWRNTAQWARQTLVDDGFMRTDSPHGTWQISDAGREYLKRV